jgi:ABC-type branched-subunit amino acid transport system ATPase component
VLLVEQHPKLALGIADYGYVISGGSVRLQGSKSELLEKLDEIEATYLSVVS